ncbi:MAG TPA: DNA repair protein RecO [Acidobacteriaceae bacterium]|jgi:DNA repair protein RecO (recombination protein O)|nr:DNA repair protein RecO [Acidobacteriaceae bacterium]
MIQRAGEAIVLRTWPFHEADLLVSLFTREQGKVKGVARHAMRSRRRFGGALEPMTHVRASYAEKPRQELVRLDAFEILSSPMSNPLDYTRVAALELVAEILDQAMPDGAPEDAVFRLAVAVLEELQMGRIWMPVTYFALWMSRLMGWMPELGRCVMCGRDLRGETVWWLAVADGMMCTEDRRPGSFAISVESVVTAMRMFRGTVKSLGEEEWPKVRLADLRQFALELLERHLEERLLSARALR